MCMLYLEESCYTDVLFVSSGCPEAIKLLVANKTDLNPEVNMKDCKVFILYNVVSAKSLHVHMQF